MNKFWKWYNTKPPSLQLAIIFLVQWLYWLLAVRLFDYLSSNEPRSAAEALFFATWMAVFMTVFFNLKKVKQLFKKDDR